MQAKTYADVLSTDMFGREASAITRTRKPIIAAVSGYCLGGGCELAMLCDFILCSDTAKFGQPEVNLGVIAGHGRHPAPDSRRGQGQGDGDEPDRPSDGRSRGRACRPRLPHRADGRSGRKMR